MLVARGRIHAALDTVMSPWDSAAVVPCIREAGGIVSTANSVTENVTFGSSLLTSANAALHGEILRLLNAPSGMQDRPGQRNTSLASRTLPSTSPKS